MALNHKTLYTALLLTLGLHTAPGHADTAEVIDAEGNRMSFEYQGNQLRVNVAQEQGSYMLANEQSLYVVTNNDGQIMVIDVQQAMSMFGGMAQAAVPDLADARVDKLEATGRKETVAGIEGEVYTLNFVDHNGQTQQAELVLSPDPRAVGFRDAMHRMASRVGDMVDQKDAANLLQTRLNDKELGVLRYGQDMRVASITTDSIDPARFTLPAEPTDLSALGGLFGGGNGSEEGGMGGIMSGIFGGNAKEAPSEEGAPAEDSLENATKEIGKAFGKLFGN
jgi:hypothetical protein